MRVNAILGTLDMLIRSSVQRGEKELVLLSLPDSMLSKVGLNLSEISSLKHAHIDFESLSLQRLWLELHAQGLNASIRRDGAFKDMDLVVQLPDAFKVDAGLRQGPLYMTLQSLQECHSRTMENAARVAAHFSDLNSIKFSKEYHADTKVEDLTFERLLGLLSKIDENWQKLFSSIQPLIVATILEQNNQDLSTWWIMNRVNCNMNFASSLMGDKEHVENAICDVLNYISANILTTPSPAKEGTHSYPIETLNYLHKYTASISELQKFCSIKTNTKSLGQTEIEDNFSLDLSKIGALTELAKSAPTFSELSARAASKGGVIVDNYYSDVYLRDAVKSGALLITHWQRDPKDKSKRLTGFVLVQNNTVDLLCVAKDAALGTAYRLSDRLLIELLAQGVDRCDSWIHGENMSSLKLAIDRGWAPDSLPNKDSGKTSWIHGSFWVSPQKRCAPLAQRHIVRKLLKTTFQTAINHSTPRLPVNPSQAAPPSSQIGKAQNFIQSYTNLNLHEKIPDLFGRRWPILDEMREFLNIPATKETRIIKAKSLEDFVNLSRDKIKILCEFEFKRWAFWSGNHIFLLSLQSVTASGQIVTFRERAFGEWLPKPVQSWELETNPLSGRAFLFALDRRNTIQKFLPGAKVDIWVKGYGPITPEMEERFVQLCKAKKVAIDRPVFRTSPGVLVSLSFAPTLTLSGFYVLHTSGTIGLRTYLAASTFLTCALVCACFWTNIRLTKQIRASRRRTMEKMEKDLKERGGNLAG